jgi:serine/threonine protein kinase
MTKDPTVEELFRRYVERHVMDGARLTPEELCRDHPDLEQPLRRWIERYHRLDEGMSRGHLTHVEATDEEDTPPPEIDGFQVVERIGRGGMGDVYKVRDLKLDRVVAAKVLRQGSAAAAAYGDFLAEARSMALFRDRRIVQIHEFRPDGDPPVILMEHVEGFELDRVAPSLDFRQRAQILLAVCEAVQHAHELGIQHRDLKPPNILLDASLSPRILDFGLSGADPERGHLVGTPGYMAPEQLDPTQNIDTRSDVYALGVIFYEMLCGERPYHGDSVEATLAAIRAGRPRLPIEINDAVPEPLQAIALKAMEPDPTRRYASAQEMALDIRRYFEGRPVLARPSLYTSALTRRLLPHLAEIEEWLRLKLIYPHEARNIKTAYERLEQREDDWIVQSRTLSYSQIALYLGGFLLVCGGLLYFGAHRFFDVVEGVTGPLLYLGLPFLGLSVAAHWLYRGEHKAVAVAYYLGSTLLLPVLLLILFYETGWWGAGADSAGEDLFADQGISNRQLQIAVFVTCCWSCWQAIRTRTIGLSSLSTLLLVLLALAVLTDFGLEEWITEGQWDLLAMHLAPLMAFEFFVATWMDRVERSWFSRPLYVGAAMLFVIIVELLALDGRAFYWLGFTMKGLHAAEVMDPNLLDTLTAMALNGILFFVAGSIMEARGTRAMKPAAWILVVIAPFATLHPIGFLVMTEDYSMRYNWLYLVLALAIAVLSYYRQRKSFYLAGLLNTGLAILHITQHKEWFDEPLWAVTVILVGLFVLGTGYALHLRERVRKRVRD